MNLRVEGEPSGSQSGQQIDWLPWGPAPFELARQRNQPVLLSIGAVWCYWCQVMEETTFQDPGVIEFISQNFVPVRVDNDHRPEINARYNVGGWPTTAFLTGHGGIVAGATYLPADQLLAMLMEVQRAYQEEKPQLYEQANNLFRQRQDEVAKISTGAELDAKQVQRIARRSAGIYDPANGGFGEEPKFPAVPVLRLLLHLFRTTGEEFYRVMLERSLDGMLGGELLDPVDGGFFRYCAQADWTEAQHEKLLEDNVGLARVYLEAWLLLDKDSYRRAAGGTVDYILNTLYDAEAAGFRGSQGAHSSYFALPEGARGGQTAPAVDPFCYANWSAQAVSLLLEASWILSRPELIPIARHVLNALVEWAQTGELSHAYSHAGRPQEPRQQLLADWASLLNALMDAHNWDPDRGDYLPTAEWVARQMVERFGDPSSGGFFDTEKDGEAVGYLKLREKPLPENVLAVQGLLKLHQATLNDEYRQLAQRALSAYVEANRNYGEFAAVYALAVDQYLNSPVEITVEGRPEDAAAQDLLRAATRVTSPHLVVKPLLSADYAGNAQAHVCLDTVCLPPVGNPDSLQATVEGGTAGQVSPFENILDRFPGL
ncbi:MAG: thioredoxin domain-containing protein [Chloroflexi bacterium]|nr:thioredoxin domain-containing protein [Chloroflexota bacterium]